jgi:hypothetical protein
MISLSLAGRATVFAAALALFALAADQFGWSIDRLGRSPAVRGSDGAAITRRLIVYQLDPVRQTTFRFTQPVRQARIITHPILKAGRVERGQSWAYAIRVELLDGLGQVVDRHEIHSRTTPLEADGRRRGPQRFYRGSRDRVAPQDEVRIASTLPFAAIRLTSAEFGRDVVAIDARVSERRPLLNLTADSAFLRYSQDDRKRLASPNALPPEVLTPAERSSIAINQWRPVGPTGIDGRDHWMRVLYEEEGGSDDDDELRFDPEDGE